MEVLVLRFDAPLMSFGGILVDQHGPTDRFPGLSLLTGLCGNALGWSHGDVDLLHALQERLEYAARWDVPPQPFLDYQTVDLGQEKMRQPGWTTRGTPEHRAGGAAARYGTHQRYRHYWANGLMTVTLTLKPGSEPTVNHIEAALRHPARPLFIGRKTCLPASPLVIGIMEARDVLDALGRAPCHPRFEPVPSASGPPLLEACWPSHLGDISSGQTLSVYDCRNWRKGVPAGARTRVEGLVRYEGGS